MTGWIGFKQRVIVVTGLPDSTLHVLAGMLLLFLAAAALRRMPWEWRPWSAVTLAELINEAYDLFNKSSGEATLRASVQDLWLTLACPTLLLLLVPWLAKLAATRHQPRPDRART